MAASSLTDARIVQVGDEREGDEREGDEREGDGASAWLKLLQTFTLR